MKNDKRFKRKPVHFRFKVHGGWVEGLFILDRIETIESGGHRRVTVL